MIWGMGMNQRVPLGSKLNPYEQTITDAMLTEEEDFYMASEDETDVYLKLVTI